MGYLRAAERSVVQPLSQVARMPELDAQILPVGARPKVGIATKVTRSITAIDLQKSCFTMVG
jgi:hypothetical protein